MEASPPLPRKSLICATAHNTPATLRCTYDVASRHTSGGPAAIAPPGGPRSPIVTRPADTAAARRRSLPQAGPARRSWAAGPAQPELQPGELHVWRADLDRLVDRTGDELHRLRSDDGERHPLLSDDELHRLLSDDERARAERIAADRRRQLWVRSRGVLRGLLARYLRSEPQTLSLLATPHGKPLLAGGAISFNLSHSGAIALYAFTAGPEVGVDVQIDRRQIDETAIARRFLTAADAQRLATLPPAERRTEFLRTWVRHEAAIKCRGTGLAADGALSAAAAAAGAEGEGSTAAAAAGAEGEGSTAAAARAEGEDRAEGTADAGAEESAAAAAGAEGEDTTAATVGSEGGQSAAAATRVPGALWLADLDVGPGAAAAVACEEEPRALQCWDL